MVLNSSWVSRFSIAGAVATALAGCSGGSKPPVAEAVIAPPPAEISIPGSGIFPESLTSSKDGAVFIGSVGQAQIYRAAPGSAVAEPFVAPGTGGMHQIFGVLADDASGTLWACSNKIDQWPPGVGPIGPSALHAFDLATGAAKASYAFPAGGMCNDIAVAANGDVFATDTPGMQVLRLAKGTAALESWSAPGSFGEAGSVLDGIAVVDGRVVVNALRTSKLFAVEVGADGKAGSVTELVLSAPVSAPDGMRAWGRGLLSTDSSGKIQYVAISDNQGTVQTVKDGLEGVVAVTVVANMAYALEGQLGIMMAAPGTDVPAEKPFRAVGFMLPVGSL